MKKLFSAEPLSFMNLALLFAVEGALLQFTGSINGFANNLFASNLNATDAQIGLIQTVPNLAAMLLMLPLGILSDRASSSRVVPLITLLAMAAGYIVMGLVPAFGGAQMTVFFTALVFTAGGTAMYNTQWQNFFGDVMASEHRNRVLTLRNRFMFIVGIAAPLLCGVMMGAEAGAEGKRRVLQLFYFICAFIALAQAAVVSRIQVPKREKGAGGFSLRDAGRTVVMLMRHRPFLSFYIPVLFFYMTWQMDWSMWYIGQTQYLHMTETALSIYNGVFNVGQLVAVGLMSRVVRRRGNDFTLTLAALGLMTCPVTMAVSSVIPESIRSASFIVLIAVFNAPQCAVSLCLVQILLRILPEKNRGLSVSLFMLSTTLTNAFMPYLGVRLYTACGSDYRAFMIFNAVVFALRIIAYAGLVFRYRLLKRRGELETL